MKRGLMFSLLVSSAILALGGCRGGAVDWPRVADCAAPIADSVVEKTVAVLLDGGEKPRLDELAREHGARAVSCALDQLFRAGARVGAEPREADLSARARAAMERVGVEPSAEPDDEVPPP